VATVRPATHAADRFTPVRDLLDHFVDREAVDGAAVAVATAGETVFEHRCGCATVVHPVTADTLWSVGSITKLYTAATIMVLIDQGVVTPAMPVHTILPPFTGGGRERVTLRHLLTHTAGLAYQSPVMEQRLLALTPLDGLIDEAYTLPLEFSPGTARRYSDLGYALLGRLATAATGTPFPELVRRLVLEPGELTETFLPPPHDLAPRIAAVTGAPGAGSPGDMYTSPYGRALAHPAFGAVATVRDLLRFGLLFVPGRDSPFLSDAARQTMVCDQVGAGSHSEPDSPLPGALPPWGLGFMVKGAAGFPALASPGSFGHSGATGCLLWIDPGYDLVLAFVSNRHAQADAAGAGHQYRAERIYNVALACLTQDRRQQAVR
jgi:CubicO group peptidase (beta-lactamase class C family)